MHPTQNKTVSRFPVLSVLVAALAACGGSELAPEEVSTDPLEAEALSSGGGGHALLLEEARAQAPARGGHLVYYGGRVLDHAEAVAVLWGSGVAHEIATSIGPFYSAALRSTYVDWLSEYDTAVAAADGQPGTGQRFGRGSLKGVVTIHPKSQTKTLADAAIRRELTAQISAGALPAPGAQTVYLVSLPPGVSVELQGTRSCVSGGFCGYHNSFRRGGKEIDYAVLPDLGPGSGCETGCGHGSKVFDNQTSVASHELIEAMTDPQVGLAKGQGRPLAWYDARSGEIGDLCSAQQANLHAASGKVYSVQKEWSNRANACIATRGQRGAGQAGDDDAWE